MLNWSFPSNNNASITGLNDAGIVTFQWSVYDSLVRESIQNSLDAKIEGSNDPVIVSFSQHSITKDSLPGFESLKEAINNCTNVKSNDETTNKFFSNALKTLQDRNLRVLKVSDYNTVGLKGGLSGEVGSSWSRLVKEAGTSNKNGVSGGSFGIGKSAYFACSAIRTVFFSSLSEDKEESNIGVAKLISYELPDNTMSLGTGYYASSNKYLAIPQQADFINTFHRDKSGTDIYIICNYIPDYSLNEKLTDEVISNFFVSIMKGLLIVTINDSRTINKNYVEEYFKKLEAKPRASLSKETSTLLDYYLILKNNNSDIKYESLDSKEFGEDFGITDNECELYLRKGDELNRKILITRKTGMKLFEQSYISSSINFSGILYISGPTMNKLFREMEGPAHNKWEPNQQSDNYKIQEAAYKQLKEYLKKKVHGYFEDQVGDEFDAFNVGQFLPDTLKAGDGKGKELTLQDMKVKIISKKIKPTKKLIKMTNSSKEDSLGDSLENDSELITGTGSNEGQGEAHFGGETPPSAGGRGTGDLPGKGVTSQTENGQGATDSDSTKDNKDNLNYKESEAKKRIMCINASNGEYKILVNSHNKSKKAKLKLTIAGEQHDFDLTIINASISSESGKVLLSRFCDNNLYFENISKDEKITCNVKINFYEHCMMGVDYYESKK